MIKSVHKSSKKYPSALIKVNNAPKNLYYIGNYCSEIFTNCIGIVGSRRATEYSKRVVHQLVKELSLYDVTIVSGFMFGIDAEAHKAALDNNLKTIAVMANSPDIITPSYQNDLYNNILQNKGLILSEYDKNIPPRKWTFVKRNRIVAALCKVILIVQAGDNSGTMITAKFAKQFGKDVYVVPYQIGTKAASGSLKLLSEGAKVAVSGSKIISTSFPKLNKRNFAKSLDLYDKKAQIKSGLAKDLFELISSGVNDINSLQKKLLVDISMLNSLLVELEIKGYVTNLNGMYHVG